MGNVASMALRLCSCAESAKRQASSSRIAIVAQELDVIVQANIIGTEAGASSALSRLGHIL